MSDNAPYLIESDQTALYIWPSAPESERPKIKEVQNAINHDDFIALFKAKDTGTKYVTEGEAWVESPGFHWKDTNRDVQLAAVDTEHDGREHECPACERTFRVEFTGPTPLHHAKTRYCPRCGERL